MVSSELFRHVLYYNKRVKLLSTRLSATIYCFNLPYPYNLKEEILEKNIKIRFHNIIYQFVQDLKTDINEIIPEVEEEEIIGKCHYPLVAAVM